MNPATWSIIVDPQSPEKSLVLYKGEPVGGVLEAGVNLEQVTTGRGPVVVPVIKLRLTTASLELGTYSAQAEEEAEGAQLELPLETK